jgi:glutamine phosphoribosylpyrophosphate amidotransferase
MCAVIGAVIRNPSMKDFEALKRVFIESKIRGMHATGISFLPRWTNDIVTIKEAIPADQFVEKHMHKDNLKEFVNADGNLYLIGHCRYSTSDLEWNQPIGNESHSIVHNGVITQELPENWLKKYGYKTVTKNDSELVQHSNDPLSEFSNMSMAVCELTSVTKELTVYRNGKRPLYLTTLPNGVIITSTADIANRAGLYLPTMEAPVNTYITFDEHITMKLKPVYIKDSVDYQNYENSSD